MPAGDASDGNRKYKSTPAALAMLRNLAAGRRANDGLSGRSAFGGATRTWTALYRHGLRDADGVITPAGLEVLEQAQGKTTK